MEDVKGDDGEALRRGVRDGFVVRKTARRSGECAEVYRGVAEFGDERTRDCDDENVVVQREERDGQSDDAAKHLATLAAGAVDADAEAHGPSRHAAPLRLGRYRDMCIRAHYDELSTECKAAVALVDDAAEAMPHHHGMCPVMLSLFLGALVGIVFLGRKIRAKKQIMKKILEAIRADTQLQALVEAKAGVSVPAPCQCKCGQHFRAAPSGSRRLATRRQPGRRAGPRG